jgi:hypothetical protein
MKALAASYLQEGRRGNSWIIGTRQRGAPRDAAYLNGTASTWHDFDEGNIIASSHPYNYELRRQIFDSIRAGHDTGALPLRPGLF